jgi:hypothetical protein
MRRRLAHAVSFGLVGLFASPHPLYADTRTWDTIGTSTDD